MNQSKFETIGIITYDYFHLKTQYVVSKLIQKRGSFTQIKLFALPFKKRNQRDVHFEHRPNQFNAMHTRELAAQHKIEFKEWDGKSIIEECDIFLITGAGILDGNAILGRKIINAHGGIIPTVRGLDSFKWAIYKNHKVGCTLHFIDKHVDQGEIISIVETPLFADDSIEDYAKRHYELENNMLIDFESHLANPIIKEYQSYEATMRMPKETEKELEFLFEAYKERHIKK